MVAMEANSILQTSLDVRKILQILELNTEEELVALGVYMPAIHKDIARKGSPGESKNFPAQIPNRTRFWNLASSIWQLMHEAVS